MNDVMKVPLRHRKAQFQNIDGDCSTSSEGSPTKHQNPQAGPPAGGPQGASKAVHQHKHFHWIMCGSFLLTINAGYINTVTLHTSHAMVRCYCNVCLHLKSVSPLSSPLCLSCPTPSFYHPLPHSFTAHIPRDWHCYQSSWSISYAA